MNHVEGYIEHEVFCVPSKNEVFCVVLIRKIYIIIDSTLIFYFFVCV